MSYFSDPVNQVGLMSIDLGSQYDTAGREYPITAMTPAFAVSAMQTGTTGAPSVTQAGLGGIASAAASAVLPSHGIARGVAILVGIGLVLIVAFRLTK